jgi:hypothetical protein
MFPLIAIGSAIGAVVSIVQGVNWLSDQLGSSKATGSTGGKADTKVQEASKVSPFEQALAAQVAGQPVPGTGNNVPASQTSPIAQGILQATAAPSMHRTDYNSLARMQAGIAAYGSIGSFGEKAKTGGTDDTPDAALLPGLRSADQEAKARLS